MAVVWGRQTTVAASISLLLSILDRHVLTLWICIYILIFLEL